MAVYTRPDSPYYWIALERPGRRPIRESTRVLVDAPTPGQRRDQRQLAEQIYRARMGDLARRRNQLPEEERPTIGFAAYAKWYQENFTVHKRTVARERSAIKNLLEHFRGFDLHEIDRERVIEWRTARSRQVKASTVNRELTILKHMLAQAVPKYLDSSPIRGLSQLRVKKAPIRIFTIEEEQRFFAHARNLEELTILLIARDTLMRLSDVKNLHWTNYHGDYIAVIDPKVEPYIVPVSPRLQECLDALPRTSPCVFPRRQRGPGSLSANTVHRIFVDTCQRSGIPQGREHGGVTFHSLRHTGTTRALERGVPIRAVQAAGGWQSLKQLERYGHMTDEGLRVFRERIGGEKPSLGDKSSVH